MRASTQGSIGSAISGGLADRRAASLPEGHAATERSDPALSCKLAEALLHEGRRDEALAYAQSGFRVCGDDPALLHVCAWVFSNCDSHGEAAAAYRRLVELCPDWI